jgi:thiol-disulfide isomerase/thioredoxin
MLPDQVRSIPRDLLAGFLAICGVLGISIYTQFVGSDLRLLFAVTGVAFFLAGLARGRSEPVNVWLKGLLVSCPGLIGTTALILNDGLHRLGIPAGVTATAILVTVAGVQARRLSKSCPGKSWLLSLFSLASLAIVVVLLVPLLVVRSSLKSGDRSIPSFSISAPDGNIVRSQELRGRVVILAFWATWCLPCRWELPELEAVYKRYANNPDVVFWAVDADWGGETPAKAKSYMARKKLDLPWAFDSGGAARAVGVDSLPTVVLLDREGHVRMTHFGYDASEHVDALISKGVQQLVERPSSLR